MDKEHVFTSLEELVSDELKALVKKGDLSPAELERAEKAVCLMEKLVKLREGDNADDGYSTRRSYRGNSMNSYAMNNYSMNNYRDGHSMDSYMMEYPESYARGRDPNTGRYVSRDYGYSGRRYYDRGYSGHSIGDRAIDCLERMMDEAGSEYERNTIKRYIEMIRSDM